MSRCTVVVVEDDPSIRRGLCDALTFAGYLVRECDNGRKAIETMTAAPADLVLLDVMLPGGMNGFDILTELRRTQPTLPVILVTARGAEEDRVRGLCDGADDYVVKPFSARELLARVEAVLRRSPQRATSARSITCGSMHINLERRELRIDAGSVVSLSEKEASILRCLAMNQSRAIDRDELLQTAWGLNPRNLETRTVDMHIARLREKLGDTDCRIIQTVRGKGYMLGPQVEVAQA